MRQTERPDYLPANAELFEGLYSQGVLELLSRGLRPWTPADVIDAKNAEFGGLRFHGWRKCGIWCYRFDTSLGIGGTKEQVIFAPEILLDITSDTLLEDGGIVLPESYTGKVIRVNKKDIGPLGRTLTKKEALAHRGWLILAGEDRDRLAKYVENAFIFGEEVYGRKEMMRFDIGHDGRLRALVFNRYCSRANVHGDINLDDNRACIIGVPVSESKQPAIPPANDLESTVRKHTVDEKKYDE